jgi:hypothetical protein
LADEKLVFIVPNQGRPFREFKTVFIFDIIIDACSAIQEKFFVSKPRFVRLKCFTILLRPAELQSLVELKHSSPPSLLGMPPPGDGLGLVAARFCPAPPGLKSIRRPGKENPRFELQRIPQTGVFEGVTKAAKNVYTCHLVIRIEMMPLAMVTVS